jgi:deoxycytidylate deaminase
MCLGQSTECQLPLRHHQFFDEAGKAALKSNVKSGQIGAVLVYGNEIVSIGHNRYLNKRLGIEHQYCLL